MKSTQGILLSWCRIILNLLTTKLSFFRIIKTNQLIICLLALIFITNSCTSRKPLLFLLKPPTEVGQNLPYEYCIGIIDPKDPENSKNTPIQVTVTTIPNSNWLSVESIQTTQADSSCGIENVVAVLKGIPKEQGEFEVVLRATKGKARGEQNFTIKVGDGNQAPRFRTKDVTIARLGKVYTYNMWAEDPEGEPVSFEKVGNLPNWLFLKDNGNGTATLTGAPRESDVGKEHKVAIEARDEKPRNCQQEGCLKEFTIRVTDANTAPIFLSEPAVRAKIGEEYSYPIEVADPDGDRLTIAMTPAESEDGWFEFNFDPEDAKDDGTLTAEIKGVPDNEDKGKFPITLTARETDFVEGGLSTEQGYTLFIIDPDEANVIPQFTSKPATLTVDEGSSYGYNIVVGDADNQLGDLTITAPTLPEWLDLITEDGRAVIRGIPSSKDIGKHQVILQVDDGTGGESQVLTIEVRNINEAPIFISQPTGELTDCLYIYNVETFDPDEGSDLTISVLEKPDWLRFLANSDGTGILFSEQPPYSSRAEITVSALKTDRVILEVSDGELSSRQEFSLTYEDSEPESDKDDCRANTPPEFEEGLPTTVIIAEGESFNYTARASDADGDPLTFPEPVKPSWINFTDNGDDSITFTGTPPKAGVGRSQVIALVSDGHSSDALAFVVEVTQTTNTAPEFTSEPSESDLTAQEDNPYSYEIIARDSDGNTLAIGASQLPNWAEVIDNGNGTAILRGVPSNEDVGEHEVILFVSDGIDIVTQTFTISVQNTNDPPEFTSTPITRVNEDNTYLYNITTTDPDIGDTLVITADELPKWLELIDNGDGTASLQGIPTDEHASNHSVELKVSDGIESDLQSFNITVSSVNDSPVAVDDAASTNEDQAINIAVLDNDSDIDGDVLTITDTSNPANGTVVVAANNKSITYTPSTNFVGEDSFIYTITDGNGSTDSAIVVVTVGGSTGNGTNDSPVATDDSAITNEDNPVIIQVLVNDTDPDNDSLTIIGNSEPAKGTVSNNGSSIIYIPTANAHGEDSFSYTVDDGNGGSDSANVNIIINPQNDSPEAGDDSVRTSEEAAITITVLENDVDVDNDALTVNSFTEPFNGVVDNSDANGTTLTYTPNANFSGVDTFTYSISDGKGGTDTATVTVEVTDENDSPTFTSTAVTAAIEDQLYSYSITATDPDGDALTFTATNTTPLPAWLNLTDNGNGTALLAGTPTNNAVGDNDVELEVSDGISTDTQSFSITVSNTADAPIFTSTPPTTAVQGQFYKYIAEATDPDGDELTINVVSKPDFLNFTASTATLSGTPTNDDVGVHSVLLTASDEDLATANFTVPQSFAITVENVNDAPVAVDDTISTNEDNFVNILVLANDRDPDGDAMSIDSVTSPTNGTITNTNISVTYTPDPNFNGTDTFNYTIEDGNGGTDTATVTVTIDPQNDFPVASDDGATTPEDTAITIEVLGNDTDIDGDNLTVDSVTQPPNGSVTNNGTNVTYTPNTNFNGIDIFNYTVGDGNSGIATAIVSVDVGGTNDSPAANDDSATTNEDNPVIIQVLANDSDPDNDPLTVASFTNPANGAVTNNTTSLTYTPNSNFSGQDSFDYTVEDGNGGTDTATVTITIDPQNDFPVANDDGVTTPEDTGVTIDVLNNDSDVDGDSLTVNSVTQPSNGTVTNNGTDVTYSPNTNFSGTDTFNYTINDGNGGTANAIVTVNVGGTNDSPVATADSATTNEDNPVIIQVLSNDSDPDGDNLNVASTTNPANGMVTNNGNSVTYTPDPNFNGTDTFNYTAEDGNGGTDTATVNVTVNAVNDAPSFDTFPPRPTSLDINEGDSFTYDIEATDPDGDVLSFNITFPSATQPSWLTLNSTGSNMATLTGSTTSSDVGSHNVLLEVQDPDGETATQSFTIDVNAIPQFDSPPVTTADETVLYTYDIMTSDANHSGNELDITAAPTLPSWLTLTDNNDGTATLSGTPSSANVGTNSVELEVSDPAGAVGKQDFDIGVVGLQAPVINSFTASANPINLVAGMGTWMSTLDWDVVGTPPIMLTIEQTVNGVTSSVGDVSNLPNIGVMPVGAPTTYTLTATNGQGTATRDLVVTVNYPSGCTDPVNIPDLVLRELVLAISGKLPTESISCFDMWELEGITLSVDEVGLVSNLDGLQHAVNIRVINLPRNNVSDLNPLQELTNLLALNLEGSKLTDISALSDLINLQILNVSGSFMDISTLPNLTNLRSLQLNGNIIDVSPLSVLNNLETLDLSHNLIVDISSFPNSPSLQTLDLSHNLIVDISNFPNFPSLQTLDLDSNRIVDISSLPNYPNLQALHLSANGIVDISSFPNLPNLQSLNFGRNGITGISGLAGSNTSLGSGDSLGLRFNCLDPTTSPDKDHIDELINRGVNVDISNNPSFGC